MTGRQKPEFVRNMTTRHGKPIRYLRINGKNICRLPSADYWSREFVDAYEAALESYRLGKPVTSTIGAERTRPGSIAALVVAYYQSAEFLTLAASTRTTYRGIIERFRVEHGDRPVASLERQHVKAIIAKRVETPAAASNLLRMIRILLRFAVDEGWRKDDPTVGVKGIKSKTDGFHSWTEEEIAAFEARWPLGTRERLAYALLIYTAQRRSDVVRMGRQHVRDGRIHVVTVKSQGMTKLWLPIHPSLREAIDAYPNDNMTFLVTREGQPFSPAGFGNWFADATRGAGLPKGCSAHGLRKAAGRRLAEAGCTQHEIMAVLGHKTLKEVVRYTAAADQRRLADSAFGNVGSRVGGRNENN